MNPLELSKQSKARLKKGSKSFAWASWFFPKELREDVAHLYSWCRECDDVTDGSTLGWHQNLNGLSRDRVEVLEYKTQLAIHDPEADVDLPFVVFGRVMRKYDIPWVYAQDLLKGMSQDVQNTTFQTFDDLKIYCYRVAGTVGVMMCYLLGLKNSQALGNAVDLGIALQLTNIARDLGDDNRVGKNYLPIDWMIEFGVDRDYLLNPAQSQNLEALCQQLLKEADNYYKSGLRGLVFLPWRCALAVGMAAFVYRSIGVQVLKRGFQAWQSRVFVSKAGQVIALFKGLWFFIKTLRQRFFQSRLTTSIDRSWRYLGDICEKS